MIEMIRFRKTNKGKILGNMDIFIKSIGMEVFGVTLFQKGSNRWASFPCKAVERNGEKKYFPHMRFRDNNEKVAFEKAVFALYDQLPDYERFSEEPSISEPIQEDFSMYA